MDITIINKPEFIFFVLLVLACLRLMYSSAKYQKLRLGIASIYKTRISNPVMEVLTGFAEALEQVPDILEFDSEHKKKFFLKLGGVKKYVAQTTADSKFLPQQCSCVFAIYVNVLNLDDECSYNVEHNIFRPIAEFCDRAEILYDEKKCERMLKFLEKEDELFLSRFEQSIEIISEFKNNPKEFISKLGE